MRACLKPVRILALASGLPFLEFNVHALDLPLLQALSQIETGDNDSAIGTHGERSRFQISRAVWETYTHVNFHIYAVKRDYAEAIASLHINKMAEHFTAEAKRNITSEDVYVMWNAGFAYYKKHDFDFNKVHKTIRERAIRYGHLVHLYQNKN